MHIFLKYTFFVFLWISFFIKTSLYAQFTIPDKPSKTNPDSVYDYIGLLSKGEKATLETKLIQYSDTTSTQIVVAIVDSVKGEEIGYLATQWAHKWGVGQEKEDNGVFILLAKNDRKITIRTGYGVEHLLTDYVSRQIITYNITPNFKQGNYYAGLNSGVNAIFKVLHGEYKGTRANSNGFDPAIIIFIIIFIIFIFIISRGGKGGGSGRNYRRNSDSRDLFETIILSNSGRGTSFGGGYSGRSSSGGFGGGFGGGGFGGGGASGGW